MDDRNDTGRTLGLIGGGALVFFGGWFLLRSFGIIPVWFTDTSLNGPTKVTLQLDVNF